MVHDDGEHRLEKFDKDLTNVTAYQGSIIKQVGVKPVAYKWDEKSFITDFHTVYANDHSVLFVLSTFRCLSAVIVS